MNNKPKIRIGNDIKLDVCLSKEYISDAINIKNIKCILINTTMAFELEECDEHCHNCHCHHDHCNDHCMKGHRPTACSLNSCGPRCYNRDPECWEYINEHRHCYAGYGQIEPLCSRCKDCHNHHCGGYGHGPFHHYHPCVCHHGFLDVRRPCHHHCHDCGMIEPIMPPFLFNDHFTHRLCEHDLLHHDLDIHPITPIEYSPEVISTPENNRFILLFPANDQRFIGNYTLIVTALIYEGGFDRDNLRTVTIDYPDIFELVETTCQADKDVIISVGTPNENNIQGICACGPNIDRVLKGNAGIFTAKIKPSSSKFKDIVWSNPTGGLDLLNKEGEILNYIGKCCDIEAGEQTFTVRASSKYFNNIFTDFEVTVFNYADRISVCSSGKYLLGDVIPYDETTTFSPEVIMLNGDRISSYIKNNLKKSATTVEGSVKDDFGVTLAIITSNGAGSYTIKNRNPYNEERTILVLIKTNIPTEDGKSLYTHVTFRLDGQGLEAYGGWDKFVKESVYDDNTYILNMKRTDDEVVSTDLKEAVGWTNK